ncbi:DUF305 domain-containing protein [Microbacterium kyungheense]|uniref:Uncharacterized protein (DUF305 family) n=1 Tax=Microbacterium kyungheense TaxID=1263636 RepID=A0A543EDP9_9MICO|nr:DUF305 domain-containing protein [Microbacterium kyungheense]TQM19727.1 uncharacterized protein (DUF305 family) [Microbacterium kyungheense]
MRRPKTVAVLAAAVVAAAAGAALAVLGVPIGESSPAEAVPSARPSADGRGVTASPSPVVIDDTVTADDYCYVEAMIYYRVKEEELAQTLLRKDDLAPAAEAFAKRVVREDVAELDDLREWYVSWAPARPLEPPTDGPCGGHGSDHAQMPGMPSWSAEQGLVDAQAPEAERRYAEIVREQNAGMVALVTLILDADPHPEVRASAEAVLEREQADGPLIDEIVPAP